MRSFPPLVFSFHVQKEAVCPPHVISASTGFLAQEVRVRVLKITSTPVVLQVLENMLVFERSEQDFLWLKCFLCSDIHDY